MLDFLTSKMKIYKNYVRTYFLFQKLGYESLPIELHPTLNVRYSISLDDFYKKYFKQVKWDNYIWQ